MVAIETLERAIASHDISYDGYNHVLMHPDNRRMIGEQIEAERLPYAPKFGRVLYYYGHRISTSQCMPIAMIRFFSPDKPFAKNVNLEVAHSAL